MGTYETAFAPLARISHDIEGTSYQADVDYLARHRTIVTIIDEVTAGTSYNNVIFTADKDCTVVSVKIVPLAVLTANDTNYRTYALVSKTAAAGAGVSMDSFTTKITGGSGNWAVYVPEAFTIDESTDVLNATEHLVITSTVAASGVAARYAAVVVVRYD